MVCVRAHADGLTVFYRSKEQFIVGSIAAVMSAIFGVVFLVVAQELTDVKAAFAAAAIGLTACALGAFASFTLFSGWRRARKPKWLVRFTPQDVHVNPIHPGYVRTVSSEAHAPLVIPLSAMEWVRKTTKPGFWEGDRDEFYVEMRVNDPVLQSASAHWSAARKAMEGNRVVEGETVLRRFEGNVIRILIEGDRWPNEISDYWAAHSYKIAAPFMIKQPVDVTSAKAQPREVF